MFPFYLSIGMTEEQYWDRDCNLVKAYRKAFEMKEERRNVEMWTEGAYFYEALCRVSPILNAFAEKGTKPMEYLNKPFGFVEKEKTKTEEEKLIDKTEQMRAIKELMMGFVKQRED